MADFVVRVEGIEANTELADKINREIQAVVLRAIAGTDFKTSSTRKTPGIRIHPEWLGIWIRKENFTDKVLQKPIVDFK